MADDAQQGNGIRLDDFGSIDRLSGRGGEDAPPATESPATEAPETEPPATEAPATESPATEAPETEAPDAQTTTHAAGRTGATTLAPRHDGDAEEPASAEQEDQPEPTVPEGPFAKGDAIAGVVVDTSDDEVRLDLGTAVGVISSRDLALGRGSVSPSDLALGDVLQVVVTAAPGGEPVSVSRRRAQERVAKSRLSKAKDAGEPVPGVVTGVVKGGLAVDVGVDAFMPASLVELRRVHELHAYVGRELDVAVVELDSRRGNVVVSRKKLLEDSREELKEELMRTLRPGEIREGEIRSVTNFGAFVDLGGVDGLVHVSELAHGHVTKPSDVAKVGQRVTVKILEVDVSKQRLALSVRATQPDPWHAFAARATPGSSMEGTVTKTTGFGAFVDLGEGIEGLIHISELAEGRVESVESVVKPKQTVTVRVLDVDEGRRRIGLSMRAGGESSQQRQARPAKRESFESPSDSSSKSAFAAAFERAQERQT